jgi:dTDP-4-amino-4,6-dideoxygalactose transaminase
MKVPFVDLQSQNNSIKREIEKKIQEVVVSQSFILGAEVEALESEIADYCGVDFGIAVSSGTDGLLASLMALEVGNEDIVITAPFTFFATVGVIARLGGKALFCDIDPETWNMDPEKLDDSLKSAFADSSKMRPKAIIPVHVFGQCADMNPILSIADAHHLPVVEDGAQAIGAEYPHRSGQKKANGMGDLGVFSFYPTKNLGAFGDAGMIMTNHEDLAKKLKLLRVHGAKDRYYHEFVGGNFRMDALQAGVLRVKLKHLDDWIEKRKGKAADYDRLFDQSGLVAEGYVQTPKPVYRDSGVRHYHTYHQYVIRARNRDKLQIFLREKGIATVIFYPLALHLQQCFSHFGYRPGDFPEAEKATAEVLALPIYPELDLAQQEYILSCIKDFYGSGG